MKHYVKHAVLIACWLFALFCAPRLAYGDERASQGADEAAASERDAGTEAYCGIGVGPLDPLITSHLPDITKKGRGVVVERVMRGSPADQAGLRRFDIVIQYDDQDIYSPEQLVKLVRHDRPGRKVPLTFVRGGKVKTAHLTLGEMPAVRDIWGEETASQGASRQRERQQRQRQQTERQQAVERERQNDPQPWASFESLKISKLADGQYQAEIDFRNEGKEVLHRQYIGTREEIRKAIEKDKELPKDEREHLLRSLDQRAPLDVLQILPKALRDFFDFDDDSYRWPRMEF